MQPGCHVGQDACDTHVVLWGRLGRREEVDVCPPAEPDMRALGCAKRESGAAVTHGDLTATAWRKAKTTSPSSAMVANVLAVEYSALHFFVVFLSSASIPPSLSSSSSSALAFSTSFAHYVMEQAKISRRLPASNPPLRITASTTNGRKRTELRGVKSCCFFNRAKSSEAARRKTSVIRRQILLPYAEKAMSILMETTECEARISAREKATTDYPRDLFPMVTLQNVYWTLPGVALLVSMTRLGKSSQTLLYFLADGSLGRMVSSIEWRLFYRVRLDHGGVRIRIKR